MDGGREKGWRKEGVNISFICMLARILSMQCNIYEPMSLTGFWLLQLPAEGIGIKVILLRDDQPGTCSRVEHPQQGLPRLLLLTCLQATAFLNGIKSTVFTTVRIINSYNRDIT